jgi:undecaprenyl diphosphate synthase
MTTIIGKQDRETPLDITYEQYQLDIEKIPEHVAIIMDGNGRWAKKRHMPRTFGHKHGAESLRATIKACVELNIHYLSVYVFSTENWKRPEKEVSFLMGLLKELIIKEIPELNKQGARVKCLGDLSMLSDELKANIARAEEETSQNSVMQINLMINYGSRHEIIQTCQKIGQKILDGEINVEDITENMFSDNLYTAGVPDPDIYIRTGGDVRTSNYLVWQSAYSEMFFTDLLWPDFRKDKLVDIVREFQERDRRFGGVKT